MPKKTSGRFDGLTASRIHAAFIHQIPHQGRHRRIVRSTDERSRSTLLGNEAGFHEMSNMVGTSRRSDAHFGLKCAARESVIPGAHERPVDLQPDGTTQGLELAGGYFELHRNSIGLIRQIVNIDPTRPLGAHLIRQFDNYRILVSVRTLVRQRVLPSGDTLQEIWNAIG
jgi:hypothetical protein